MQAKTVSNKCEEVYFSVKIQAIQLQFTENELLHCYFQGFHLYTKSSVIFFPSFKNIYLPEYFWLGVLEVKRCTTIDCPQNQETVFTNRNTFKSSSGYLIIFLLN